MTLDWSHLIEQLPHKPPMRLVDEVVSAAEDAAVCRVRITDTLCNLFGERRSMRPYACVEIIAQTAAIALASAGPAGKAQPSGVLVQVGQFKSWVSQVPIGTILRCETSLETGLEGRVALVQGSVFLEDGQRVCEAKLTLAIDRL